MLACVCMCESAHEGEGENTKERACVRARVCPRLLMCLFVGERGREK